MGFGGGCGYFITDQMRGGLVTDISPDTETEHRALDATGFEEWPDSDLDIDDDAFAEAIARGREHAAAA